MFIAKMMSIPSVQAWLWCALLCTSCLQPPSTSPPTNKSLGFLCTVANCVVNNHRNAVAFRVTNDSDQDVRIRAWSLSPYQIVNEAGETVPPSLLTEAVAPPIQEYMTVRKHSTLSYAYPSEFFSNYPLVEGGKYVLLCRYGEQAKRKRGAPRALLNETVVPNTPFTACK